MVRIAAQETGCGITQIQVKFGADRDNEVDIATLRKACDLVPAGKLVYGDWNSGASRLDATRVGRAVTNLDIMLEQPCATLEEFAAVRDAADLAMKTDGNGHDTALLIRGWQLGYMDAVELKLSKFGGLSQMRRARDLCLDLGVKMYIEKTWGLDITKGTALHLTAATPLSGTMNVCSIGLCQAAPRPVGAVPRRPLHHPVNDPGYRRQSRP